MAKPTRARLLEFKTLDDILDDARRVAAHPDVAARGVWTPAQNIWHVGRIVLASVEGFPASVPLMLRLVGPFMKSRYTKRSFSPGIKMPASMAEHFEPDPGVTMPQGLAMIESAVAKRKDQGYIPASPLFGKLSATQWEQLHCRHAEMHFGLIDLKD